MNDLTDEMFSDLTTGNETTIQDSQPEDDENGTTDEEILTQVPEGAITIGDFVRTLTYTFDTDADGNKTPRYDMVLPASVYQALKRKRDPLAHVLVRDENAPDDVKPTPYILPEAYQQWDRRFVASASRIGGSGGPTSRRSPDELRVLFPKAVDKLCYNKARAALWDERVVAQSNLVDKYRTWMGQNGIGADEIDKLYSDAVAAFNADDDTSDNPETSPDN
jgi:hypothetical protein